VVLFQPESDGRSSIEASPFFEESGVSLAPHRSTSEVLATPRVLLKWLGQALRYRFPPRKSRSVEPGAALELAARRGDPGESLETQRDAGAFVQSTCDAKRLFLGAHRPGVISVQPGGHPQAHRQCEWVQGSPSCSVIARACS
jgi:hypothetical protein